jgi:phytoene/squalene synthetase
MQPMGDGEPPARKLGDTRGASGAQVTGEPRSPASTAGQGDTPHMLSPSRYLACLYSPAPKQAVLERLCEIESEIASSLRAGIDHHVAHARLQWWQGECERCVQGRPVHPLTRELVKAYGAPTEGEPSPLSGVSGFVDTAVWDLASATFETRKELTAYCERWAAAMFETAAAQVVSAASSAQTTNAPRAASRWRTLGAAVREIELLGDLAREAHAGRVRLPLDELERAGVGVKSLAESPWPAPLALLLRERHEALRAIVGESLAAFGREEQPGFRGLLVWAALAWRQSARVQRALPNIILPRRYYALTDGWQAWRAARRAAAGNLRLS